MFLCKHLPIIYTAWQMVTPLPRCKWRDGEGHCHNPTRKRIDDPCPFDRLFGNPVQPARFESRAEDVNFARSESFSG